MLLHNMLKMSISRNNSYVLVGCPREPFLRYHFHVILFIFFKLKVSRFILFFQYLQTPTNASPLSCERSLSPRRYGQQRNRDRRPDSNTRIPSTKQATFPCYCTYPILRQAVCISHSCYGYQSLFITWNDMVVSGCRG